MWHTLTDDVSPKGVWWLDPRNIHLARAFQNHLASQNYILCDPWIAGAGYDIIMFVSLHSCPFLAQAVCSTIS